VAVTDETSQNDGRAFRWVIGVLTLLTAICGFAALFFLRVPVENKDAMMFALGSVFGWASNVVASEYGSTATGRKVTESVLRNMDKVALDTPSGTPEDPFSVAGAGPGQKPVDTKVSKGGTKP
jgi:hypothetical protein